MTVTQLTLTTEQVAHFAGLPIATLHTWVRTGRVQPSVARSRGRRRPLLWSARDAVGVRAIARMRRSGVSGQQLRRVADYLRSALGTELQHATLICSTDDLWHVDRAGDRTAVLRQVGQLSLIGAGLSGADLLAQVTRDDTDTDAVLIVLPVGIWHRQAEQIAQAI